MKFELCLLFS